MTKSFKATSILRNTSFAPGALKNAMPRSKTPETLVKSEIKQWCKLNGWACLTVGASPFSTKGLPDFVLIKDGITAFVEAKGPAGKLREEQKEVQAICEHFGGVYLEVRRFEELDILKGAYLMIPDTKGHPSILLKHEKGMRWIWG